MWWRKYVGVPYKDFGRSTDGCDCWGLLRLVYAEEFGIELPSYIGGYESPRAGRGLGTLIGQEVDNNPWGAVLRNTERSGDAVLLALRGYPCHVGIVTAPGDMLHVTRGIDAVVESYRGSMWARRLKGVYRYEPTR